MPIHKQILTQKDKQAYVRLTASTHVNINSFKEHKKIEGYFENREMQNFIGSDRLLKLDTLYGTIQLGYNPRKGQSFLFANIKTSIFDTAASKYQHELKEYQMMRGLKKGTQNVAYTAKRRAASAVILYKMENQPWTHRSVLPYLNRVNMEALQKTMPFLDKRGDIAERRNSSEEQKALQIKLRSLMIERKYGKMASVRGDQLSLIVKQNEQNAIIYRKDSLQRLFFRKLNYALDIQKHEMFEYYRNMQNKGGSATKKEADLPDNNQNKAEEQDD